MSASSTAGQNEGKPSSSTKPARKRAAACYHVWFYTAEADAIYPLKGHRSSPICYSKSRANQVKDQREVTIKETGRTKSITSYLNPDGTVDALVQACRPRCPCRKAGCKRHQHDADTESAGGKCDDVNGH